ncbi:uncharacterized protein LOC134847870 isoform X1 [Symsagittifera roscoffensis]|uniref:uncharacterized protein LOC134847870 isoform X1 n=1 Tax=Symsagittifera roscoffensis TaxID=84072 RepID=UPI00307C05C7
MVQKTVPRINFECATRTNTEHLFCSSSEAVELLAQSLLDAFEDVGFFVVYNHGIDPAVLGNLKEEAANFFGCPTQCKEEFVRRDPKREMFGYTAQDKSTEVFDRSKPSDIKETFEFSPNGLDPVPSEEWQRCRELLSGQFSDLFHKMLVLLARALGLKSSEILTNKIKGLGKGQDGSEGVKNRSAFRSALYPQVKKEKLLPNQLRCGLHCDYGCLTFIYKTPFEKGLKAKQRGGDMIDVFCSEEGDLIVNAGECLQMITGDLIRAAPHLVQFPTAATETSCDNYAIIPSAFSLIMFGLFDDDAQVETIEQIGHTRSGHKKTTLYAPFMFGDYFDMRINKVFVEGQGLIQELLE